MKVVRAALVALTAAALAASPALAQGGPPPGGPPPGAGPGGPQRRMQMMLQGITLSPAQQAQLDSINARFTAQMPAMTPGVRPDSAQMAQRRAIVAQRDSTLRAMLTAEQQTVWDRNIEQMRANMPPRP